NIRLEKRGRRNKVTQPSDGLADMTASVDPDCLRANHERSWLVMHIDEKAVGLFLRFEQSAHWTSKSFVVTRHDQHRDGFPIIFSRPDDQMSKHSCQSWPGRADSRPGQTITKGKGDSVCSRTLYRTFFDLHNALGSAFVMPHDQPTASRSWAENECDLL